MPHVHQNDQLNRKGNDSKVDIKKTHRETIARDNLRSAFAGDQNRAAKGSDSSPTHLKSRRLRKGSGKTPKR